MSHKSNNKHFRLYGDDIYTIVMGVKWIEHGKNDEMIQKQLLELEITYHVIKYRCKTYHIYYTIV